MEFKSFMEVLKGKQHKIDKNKNGKIDAHDFKLLQKEEQEITEATVKTQKYSWGTMKTVHHGSDFSIPLHPEHHKEIAKLKDQQEHKFKTEDGKHWTAKRSGDDVHFQGANGGSSTKVKHSTMSEESHQSKTTMKHIPNASPALKKAAKDIKPGVAGYRDRIDMLKAGGVKEEVELDEAFINGREYASHGLMHPDHAASAVHKVTGNTVDFYAHGSGDKVSGKVTKNDGKAVHIKDASGKTHQFKVTPHLPKQQNEETAPWETEAEAKARKASSNFKKPSNPTRTGMDTARALAQKAMKQKMKEEFGLEITDEQADSLLEMSHAPVAPVLDRKYIKGTPEHKAYKATKKPINGIPTGKYKEDIDFNDEGTLMTKTVSYKEFLEINEIKMSDLPSRIVRGTSYGANYSDPEGSDDYDDKKPVKAAPEKRGRGRPSGAQSGARKNLGNSKLHTK